MAVSKKRVAPQKRSTGEDRGLHLSCMPANACYDPVIRVYMRDVDRTLLRENLKLTPAQRLEKFVHFASFTGTLHKAGLKSLRKKSR